MTADPGLLSGFEGGAQKCKNEDRSGSRSFRMAVRGSGEEVLVSFCFSFVMHLNMSALPPVQSSSTNFSLSLPQTSCDQAADTETSDECSTAKIDSAPLQRASIDQMLYEESIQARLLPSKAVLRHLPFRNFCCRSCPHFCISALRLQNLTVNRGLRSW